MIGRVDIKRNEHHCWDIKLDGVNIAPVTRRLNLSMSVDEVPVVTLEIPYLDGEMSVNAEINHGVKLILIFLSGHITAWCVPV